MAISAATTVPQRQQPAAGLRGRATRGPDPHFPQRPAPAPTAAYHCAYVTRWVETKLRWNLAADDREREALLGLAEDCPGATVTYESVP